MDEPSTAVAHYALSLANGVSGAFAAPVVTRRRTHPGFFQIRKEGTTPVTNNTSDTVLTELRDALVRGDFVPEQRLVEADLSERFTASRSAVRAALIQLTEEGLVERIQNRGARVRAISVAEAVEICEVRMVLEGLCAAKAAENATTDARAELREIGTQMTKAVENGDVVGYSENSEQLHLAIRKISGQDTADAMVERLRAQSVRHQFRLNLIPGRPSVSLSEHLAIIEAICVGDSAAAERTMRLHLANVIIVLRNTVPRDPHSRFG